MGIHDCHAVPLDARQGPSESDTPNRPAMRSAPQDTWQSVPLSDAPDSPAIRRIKVESAIFAPSIPGYTALAVSEDHRVEEEEMEEVNWDDDETMSLVQRRLSAERAASQPRIEARHSAESVVSN